MTSEPSLRHLLVEAANHAGIDPSEAESVRLGQNAIYRLRSGVIARIARTGQYSVAAREVAVAQWLHNSGIPAVQIIPDIDQPVKVEGRAVTFWHELPRRGSGNYTQVADLIKRVHHLPAPDFLPPLEPFGGLTERIDAARTFDTSDRDWMHHHLVKLRREYASLPSGLSDCAIHGDAHRGNVAALSDGTAALLDLESFSVGPPEWDLMLAAFDYRSCGWLQPQEYRAFVDHYGHDVMESPRYAILRDIREFRKVLFAAQLACDRPELHSQASHRLACIRGERGGRPWSGWRPVP
jgi:aminoglycoside phosphotransferase